MYEPFYWTVIVQHKQMSERFYHILRKIKITQQNARKLFDNLKTNQNTMVIGRLQYHSTILRQTTCICLVGLKQTSLVCLKEQVVLLHKNVGAACVNEVNIHYDLSPERMPQHNA